MENVGAPTDRVADRLSAAVAAQRNGDVAVAEAEYRSILADDPGDPRILYVYGSLSLRAGRTAEALDLLQRAVALRPDHAESRIALGHARRRSGDRLGAMALWRELASGNSHAALDLARALREEGDVNGAIRACHAALERDPSHGALWTELAAALLAADADADALAITEEAVDRDRHSAFAWLMRGTALGRCDRPEEAEGAFRQALRLDPEHAQAHLNLGNLFAELDRFADAEAAMREALRLDPGLIEAHVSLGHLLSGLGRHAEAVEACETALRLDPNYAPAHWNQANALLLSGDYRKGFAKYEWRKQHFRYAAGFWTFQAPSWLGEALDGRTILVLAEQGLGDTIMCSRYLPLLADGGGRVVLSCARPLMRLLGRLHGVAEVIERSEPRDGRISPITGVLPAHDTWIDQMTLPRVFETTVETIPSPGGWLAADPGLEAAWACRLAVAETRRVGLVWAGNPEHSNDRRRSMDCRHLAPILAVPGLSFVSLQVGPRSADAARFPQILDVSASLADYEDTAACIANLDVVVTVDTSVCHLAGALGKPVFLMLPYVPEWRWLPGRDDTPWYSGMRLFRQPAPGAWGDVTARVADALAQ